jgi:hypothetical protein
MWFGSDVPTRAVFMADEKLADLMDWLAKRDRKEVQAFVAPLPGHSVAHVSSSPVDMGRPSDRHTQSRMEGQGPHNPCGCSHCMRTGCLWWMKHTSAVNGMTGPHVSAVSLPCRNCFDGGSFMCVCSFHRGEFRTKYSDRLNRARNYFKRMAPNVRCYACTATAPPRLRREIALTIDMRQVHEVVILEKRENLSFNVGVLTSFEV